MSSPKRYVPKTSCLLCLACFTITYTQAQLKVQTGAVISFTGGAGITLYNTDLDNDGTINQAAGQGSFLFNGNTNNTITGTSAPLFDILQIAKTGNAILSLQQGIQIGTGLTFTSGIIDLNAQNIHLQPTASLNGESETSHITGANGGYVEITTTLNAPASVNPGNLGAVITSAQNLGSTIIRRGHLSQTSLHGAGNSILRYYDIIPTNDASLNATLQLNYLNAELNSLDPNSLLLWKSVDNTTWHSQGFDSRNTTPNYVTKGGLSDFSRWTLSSPNNPLPLIWGTANTHCISTGTQISWQTLQEQNTTSFVIRRSTDGIAWTEIGSVPAAGNSQTALLYSYTDLQTPAVASYYQLLQRDLDGRQTYSPVLMSHCGQPESIKLYPNPAQNNCWVSIQSESATTVTLRLYDSRGALVQTKAATIQSGNNQFELSLSGMATGNYSLVITWSDGKVNVVKLEKY